MDKVLPKYYLRYTGSGWYVGWWLYRTERRLANGRLWGRWIKKYDTLDAALIELYFLRP